MIARTNYPCSLCGQLLIDQHGAFVCAHCDRTDSGVLIDAQGVYVPEPSGYRHGSMVGDGRPPITHCVRGCGQRLTVADRGTTCRQCRLTIQPFELDR